MKKSIILCNRQVTRGKAKSCAIVKHQRKHVVLKTTSNVKGHFKSGFAPLYCSLVTSLCNVLLLHKICILILFTDLNLK